MAISPDLFGDPQEVLKHIADVVSVYRKSTPLDPNLQVLVPGDKEQNFREKALEDGIELSSEIIDQLREVATVANIGKELDKILETSVR
jgi:LDH2 family malate/lactate/ureidoglycolate dehydrogenase